MTQMTEAALQTEIHDRTMFEVRAYSEYLQAERKKAFENPNSFKGIASHEEFFKMTTPHSGEYAVPALNFAWCGYQWGLLDAKDEIKSETSDTEVSGD